MPATKLQGKTMQKYIKVKDFAEIYDMSQKTVYQMIKDPVFFDVVKKIGTRGIRLDKDKMVNTMEQYYR